MHNPELPNIQMVLLPTVYGCGVKEKDGDFLLLASIYIGICN